MPSSVRTAALLMAATAALQSAEAAGAAAAASSPAAASPREELIGETDSSRWQNSSARAHAWRSMEQEGEDENPMEQRESREERGDGRLQGEQGEQGEEQHRQRRNCSGPQICFSADGSKCFANHPAGYCMRLVIMCVKYMMRGCQQPGQFYEQQWEQRFQDSMLVASPAAAQSSSTRSWQDQRSGAVLLLLTATAATLGLGGWLVPLALRRARFGQARESVDQSPLLG